MSALVEGMTRMEAPWYVVLAVAALVVLDVVCSVIDAAPVTPAALDLTPR